MASTVGSLLIDIGLSTARLSSDVGKATQTIKNFTDRASKEFESFKNVAAGLAGVLAGSAGVAGITSFARAVVNSADEMNKASQKYGIGVESLSALKYSASLADVEFEALGTGLKKLSQAMSEGDKAFKLIGVSVKDSSGSLRGTEDVLADVADRFAGMEDGAGKTALAVKLFGKAGADLIPFLNGGSKGIRENTEEAKKLGAVLSGETARAAEEFNDNMTRLTTAASSLGKAIVKEMLPGLADTTFGMVEWAKEGNNLRDAMSLLADTVKVLAVSSLPLMVAKIAAAAGGASSLAFAVQNLGFVMKYFAVTTLGPMLLNPITIATAAIAALAAGYLYLSGRAGEAAEAQKKFAASLAGESRSSLKAQADAIAYALDEAIRYEARWNQIADERHAAGNNLSAASARRAAHAWAEKRSSYQGMLDEIDKARIKMDQIKSSGGGKTSAPSLGTGDVKKADPLAGIKQFSADQDRLVSFHEESRKIGNALEALERKSGEGLSSELQKLDQAYAEFAGNAVAAYEKGALSADQLASVLDRAFRAVGDSKSTRAAAEGLKEIEEAGKADADQMNRLREESDAAFEQMQAAVQSFNESALSETERRALELDKSFWAVEDALHAAYNSGAIGFEQMTAKITAAKEQTQALKEETDRLAQAQLQGALDAQRWASQTPAARFDAASREGDTGGMLSALETNGFGQQLLAIDEARAKSEAFMEVWRSANITMGQALTSIGMGIRDSITSNLTSIITGAKTAAQAFKDLGKSVLSMLAEMLVKWVVNRTIMAVLGKTMLAAETAASVAAGGMVAAAWAPAAAAVSLASFGANAAPAAAGIVGVYGLTQALSVPALAEGGIIERPTLVLAGEAGREAIVPLDRDAGGVPSSPREYVLQIDGDVIARWMERAVRQGRMQLVPA